jgi:hypothetical protein
MLAYLTLAAQGGYLYLGYFLYQYLAGTSAGFPYVHRIRDPSSPLTEFLRGFQSTSRANPFAQKILEAVIDQGLNRSLSFYSSDNCKLSWYSISVKCDIYGRAILEWHSDASQL